MPSTPDSTFESLARPDLITPRQWLDLIEARVTAINPYLDTFTLTTLENFQCVRGRNSDPHALKLSPPMGGVYAPGCTTYDQAMKIQALWCSTAGREVLEPGGGSRLYDRSRYYWAYTRKRHWLLIRLYLLRVHHEAGWDTDQPHMMKLEYSSPGDIVCYGGFTLPGIWLALGQAIHEWEWSSWRRYREARDLSSQVAAEEAVFRGIIRDSHQAAGHVQIPIRTTE